MPRYLLIDEFHLEIAVEFGAGEQKVKAIRRQLGSRQFNRELRGVVRDFFNRHSFLRAVRVRLTR